MSMAFAKPIIGVVNGDGKDLLLKAGGSICCEQNAKSVADAINKLFSLSIEDRKKLGRNNQVYYSNNLSIESCGKKINQILLNELI